MGWPLMADDTGSSVVPVVGQMDLGARWYARLRTAENYRRREIMEWNANRYTLLGRNYRAGYLKRGESVNLAWAAFQTMVGSVFSRNPDFLVRETEPVLQLTARMLTTAATEDFANMQSRYVTRLCMMDVFWAGVGYAMEKLSNDITSMAFKYTDIAEDGTRSDKEGLVPVPTGQRYTLSRIHPEAMLMDPVGVTPNMLDHKWAAVEYYPTVKELREDNFYDIDEETIRGLPKLRTAPQIQERVVGMVKTMDAADDQDDEFLQVRFHEIWDRINREVLYQPHGVKKIVAKRQWPVDLRLNGELLFPWATLYFNENPDQFWPIPEISLCRPQFEQFSILFRQILADAVGKWRRYLYRSDVVSKAQVDKIRSGGPTELVGVDPAKWNDPSGKPMMLDQVVRPIEDPTVKNDMVAVAEMVKNIVHEIVGAGDFASGGMRNTRSATEAAALSDFMRVRTTNRTENIDAFFQRLLTNHILFLQETAVVNRRVKLIDQSGMEVWKAFNKEDIQGEFRFDVVAGSSTSKNTETRRQENIAFFQQAVPIVLQTGGDPRPLIEWMAPFYKMPQHLIDQIYKNHRQYLLQAALLIKKAYLGQPGADPTQFMEAVSAAVMSGLSASEIAAVDQQAQIQATQAAQAPQQAPGGAQQPPGGDQGGGQPVSPPGTNTGDQTVS